LTEKQRKIKIEKGRERDLKSDRVRYHLPDSLLRTIIKTNTGAPKISVYTSIMMALTERSG